MGENWQKSSEMLFLVGNSLMDLAGRRNSPSCTICRLHFQLICDMFTSLELFSSTVFSLSTEVNTRELYSTNTGSTKELYGF